MEQVSTEMFRKEYAEVFSGTEEWKAIKVEASDTYDWQEDSTYIRPSMARIRAPRISSTGSGSAPISSKNGDKRI